MGKVINEVGNKHGKLIVLSRHKNHHINNSHSTRAFWLCKCDCGNKTIVEGTKLRSSHSRSCGCLGSPNKLPKGEAAFNRLIKNLKWAAKKREHIWGLSKEEVRQITSQNCFYCGIPPLQSVVSLKNSSRYNDDYLYNGIDRVDNSRGYILSNCVPCCGKCNRMKFTMSKDDFCFIISRVYKYWVNPLIPEDVLNEFFTLVDKGQPSEHYISSVN